MKLIIMKFLFINIVKGWLHDSPHPHDASDNIRCFYCRTCPGIKVFFNKKLIAIVIVNYYLFFTY